MALDHVSSDPSPQCSTTVLEQDSLSPDPQIQENVPQIVETVTTSNELEFLYSLMFSELLNGNSLVVSKSSVVHVADNPDKRQQHNTTHTSTTTDVADLSPLKIHLNTSKTQLKYQLDMLTKGRINSKSHLPPVARLEAVQLVYCHGMTSCDSIGTPMATKHLDADLSGTLVDQMKYRSMVGALMYLTASRPDIVHATCYCARYQAKPTEKHLTAVKRIFRYLKDSINMGLWYPKDTSFELTAFSDSDHAGLSRFTLEYITIESRGNPVQITVPCNRCQIILHNGTGLKMVLFKYLVRRLRYELLDLQNELEVYGIESV
ncbi:hypothetical protein Tco_0264626 [Tanacetum coccineum]